MIDHLPESYAGFDREDHMIEGVKTVVLTMGQGPELVFLHGTGTFTGFDAARRWAKTHRVIIPFHPGFGMSGDAPEVRDIEDHVFHYMALFDAMKLDRVALAGFSLGGWIAAEFALRQPQRVSCLVLLAPAGLVSASAPAPDLFSIAPEELPGYLAHNPARVLSFFPSEPDPEFDNALGREVSAFARLIETHPQGNPDLTRRLPRLRMPTLLIWGGEDRLRPTAQSQEWVNALPQAQLKTVPNTGHLILEETPESATLVTDFLVETDDVMAGRIVAAEASWEATEWHILGQTYRLKQQGRDSMAWHATFPPGTFVPPHIHPDQDEFVYVLSGEYTIRLGGEESKARAGDLVVMPRGLPHGIFNTSSKVATSLFWVAPSRALRALFDAIDEVPDPDEVIRLAGLHNVHFLSSPGPG